MADIDIKEKSSIWPWVVVAVVIAIILLIIFIDSYEAAEPAPEGGPLSVVESIWTPNINKDMPVIA